MKEGQEKTLDRVRKLLRMAADTSSPHEAAIAAGRARKLIDKYQISDLDLTSVEDAEFGEQDVSMGTRSVVTWKSILAAAVSTHNDVKVILTTFSGVKNIRFSGFLIDAICATEEYKYLTTQADKQAIRFNTGRADRNAYRLGCATGVSKHVRELIKEREKLKTTNGTELVVVKKALVEKKYGVARLASSMHSFTGDNSSYNNGKSAGYSTSLNRQVSGAQQGKLA